MRNSNRMLTLLVVLVAGLFLFGTTVYAGNEEPTRQGFVDLNGDGFNDNMKDSDADGIPNAVDDDFAKSGEGTDKEANAYAYQKENAYQNAYQYQYQTASMVQAQAQLTFNYQIAEQFQNQLGELGEGSGTAQMNQSAIKGSENTGHKGGSE
ncbi:MAG: hypothetical protein JSW34_07510 [Candidatus Zixiibacteriota bacterium]|nr:MAG: hypothetical protein JSW34_07510 [candidate division Zixibacteria bacterium]